MKQSSYLTLSLQWLVVSFRVKVEVFRMALRKVSPLPLCLVSYSAFFTLSHPGLCTLVTAYCLCLECSPTCYPYLPPSGLCCPCPNSSVPSPGSSFPPILPYFSPCFWPSPDLWHISRYAIYPYIWYLLIWFMAVSFHCSGNSGRVRSFAILFIVDSLTQKTLPGIPRDNSWMNEWVSEWLYRETVFSASVFYTNSIMLHRCFYKIADFSV